MNIRGIPGEKVGHATVTHSVRTVIREGAPVAGKPRRKDAPGTCVKIVLPLIPYRISPNGRLGYYKKASAVKKHRELAYFATWAAMKDSKIAGGWEKAEATERFFWPTKARHDLRNAEGANKPYWDGVCDANLIVDDRSEVLTHLPSEFAIDRENPRLEIRVWKL